MVGILPGRFGVLWWLSIPCPLPVPGAACGAIAFLAGLGLLVGPAATLAQIVNRCRQPWTYFVEPFEAVAFKLPMLLLVLPVLGILDDR